VKIFFLGVRSDGEMEQWIEVIVVLARIRLGLKDIAAYINE
jgi:hypothetical protein